MSTSAFEVALALATVIPLATFVVATVVALIRSSGDDHRAQRKHAIEVAETDERNRNRPAGSMPFPSPGQLGHG